jgi:hypothetical protein
MVETEEIEHARQAPIEEVFYALEAGLWAVSIDQPQTIRSEPEADNDVAGLFMHRCEEPLHSSLAQTHAMPERLAKRLVSSTFTG